MITASLKQHVSRRANRVSPARFKLLVKGRVRGVWEKRSFAPKLLSYKKESAEIAPAGERLKRLIRSKPAVIRWKPVVFALAALAALVLIALVIMAFARPSVGPLELPAAGGVLRASNSGPSESEDDTAGADASPAPLALKKLKLSGYRVRPRDTLPDIAGRTGLNVDTIISFNAIRDANALKPGAELTLPNRNGLRHLVRPGESLLKISKRYGVKFDDLLDWNNLSRSVITVGQGLFIPGARLSAAERNRVLGTEFAWPVRGKLSSRFGMRLSPITGTRLFHNGIDISNRRLTPIQAAAAGRVARVDYNPKYGNYIILVHDNGFQTLYGHLEQTYVKKGQSVSRGAKIGGMGTTGASTGYHLHFSIYKNSREVDPLKYLR